MRYVKIVLDDKLGGGSSYQFDCIKNEAKKIGLEAQLIEEGDKDLCKFCKSKRCIKIDPYAQKDFGEIVIHKKDCTYLKNLIDNSVEL